MKKNIKWIILGIMLITLIIVAVIALPKIKIKEFSNNDFKIKYDTTWKQEKKDSGLLLTHKKSKSTLEIQSKILPSSYMNTPLKDIVSDVIYSIEEQNQSYKLITQTEDLEGKYEDYSYLYEKDDTEVLVRIYKQDHKLIIIYFEAKNTYYDIVLDSVDTMFETLEIITREEITAV